MEYKPDEQLEQTDFGVVEDAPSTLDDLRSKLKKRGEGVVLQVPSGLRFRVTRPNISTLVKTGQMPNSLIGTAIQQQKGFEPKTSQELKEVFELVDFLVKLAVKQPQLDDEMINDMEDDDKFVIFNYVMGGVDSLQSFRNQLRSRDVGQSVPEVQQATQ